MKKESDAMMIRYLLGNATEDEKAQLEQKFFVDDERYQELLAIEDELRYDYAQGGLTREQRKLFEARYLTTTADREKVALAQSVLKKAFELERKANPKSRQAIGWFSKLFSPGVLQFAGACAALVLVVISYGLFLQTIHLKGKVSELEAEATRAAQQTRQSAAEQSAKAEELNRQLAEERQKHETPGLNYLSFVLAPGLTRDLEGPKPIVIAGGANTVRFRLDIAKTSGFKSYRVQLQNVEGAQLWSQDLPEPVLTVPAQLLPPGDYEVILRGITKAGETEDAGDFYFSVVRR